MERISREKQKKFYFPIFFKRKQLENREDYKIESLLKIFLEIVKKSERKKFFPIKKKFNKKFKRILEEK